MFILLINYVVMSFRRCKGTVVLGGGQTFRGLLPEVVATGAGICDKALMRRQNRVAKQSEKEIFFLSHLQNLHQKFGDIRNLSYLCNRYTSKI